MKHHLLVRHFVSRYAVLCVLTCCVATAAPAQTAENDTTPAVAVDVDVRSTTVPVAGPTSTDSILISLSRSVADLKSEVSDLRTLVESNDGPGSMEASVPADSSSSVAGRVGAIGEGVGSLALPIFISILIILVMLYVIKFVVWILEVSSEQNATRRLLFKRMIPIVRVVLWSVAIYVILADVFNVNASQLLAASAAGVVAIGFAAQDILKNIFGGILIILDKPFQVGDKINVGGTYGEVVAIGLRSTRITTPDDNLVSVPNAQVVDGQVANANAGALDCQVVTNLYLPGWVDATKAKQIAIDAASNSEFVYLDKPIVVLVRDEFKETFLTHLLVKAYVIDTRFEMQFSSDVTEMAKAAFLREGMLSPLVNFDTLTQTMRQENGDHGSESPS